MADNHFKIHKGTTHAPQTSAPSNPTDGDIYYDSTLGKFRAYEDGAWVDVISTGAGFDVNTILVDDVSGDVLTSDGNVLVEG